MRVGRVDSGNPSRAKARKARSLTGRIPGWLGSSQTVGYNEYALATSI